jgi:uncharacterized membrane protein YeaQ/YmgE (transglycosylase-associated protein family)
MSFSSKFTGKNPINKQDPPNQSNALSNIEHKAEEVLNFPQEKARQRTDEYLSITPDKDGLMEEQNSFEHGDTARHYFAGDQTSRAIQNKLKYLGPITKRVAGIVGSNVGGLIHEAQNIREGRPILESVEDATNNFVGSLGSLFSKNTSTKILDRLKKYLPDGKFKN